MTTDFTARLYELADGFAEHWGTNRGTKVGAVVYEPEVYVPLCLACNELPEGMDPADERYHAKPLKLLVWEHAERNAIFTCAKLGLSTAGLGIAVNWYPCAECARAIVQAGFAELIAREPDWEDARWGESHKAASEILDLGGVDVAFVTDNGVVVEVAPETPVVLSNVIQFPSPLPVFINPLEPIVS